VIGKLRRDTADAQNLASKGRPVPESHRYVRVLETEFARGFRATSVADYVVEPVDGGWRLVRRIGLMSFD
jgi:hypothetical protein